MWFNLLARLLLGANARTASSALFFKDGLSY